MSKEDILQIFNESPRKIYKKKGRFLARPAIPHETILTIVSGHLETLKRADENSIVLRNIEIGSSAETYIIDRAKFEQRYDYVVSDVSCDLIIHNIDGAVWNEVIAKGRCEAKEYSGDTIQFMAPWEEPMMCQTGDFLARPIPGDANDIYRIERQAFLQTYMQESL